MFNYFYAAVIIKQIYENIISILQLYNGYKIKESFVTKNIKIKNEGV